MENCISVGLKSRGEGKAGSRRVFRAWGWRVHTAIVTLLAHVT
jgi:hypothetical protein